MRNPSVITVNVLNFYALATSHLEIILECQIENQNRYYLINRWCEPAFHWKNSNILKNRIGEAQEHVAFSIKANPEEICKAWQNKATNESGNIFTNNCAHACEWFLQEFADLLKNKSTKPGCNYLFCGLFAPNFLVPSVMRLPGRVFDEVKQELEDRDMKFQMQ